MVIKRRSRSHLGFGFRTYKSCNRKLTSKDHVIKGSRAFMGGLVAICHHPDKCRNHRPCDSSDLMFSICNVT